MLDVHTHFFPRGLNPPSDSAVAQGWPVAVDEGGRTTVYQQGKVVRVLDDSASDATARLRDMDEGGVEAQVVMPTPFTFLYDADPEVAIRYAQQQNDQLADLVGAGEGRLHGLGALPLQDPASAVAEARRLVTELRMPGVEIGTHAGRSLLHDHALEPVLAELEALGAAVFVHPWRPVAPERSSHNGLAFGLGRPVETELAVGSLIFGGILERHPRLRLCVAHGGGGVPALRGRLRNGWERQDEAARRPSEDPRKALTRIWADGLTYDAMAYALAEDTFGTDRMVVGSDYPFAAQENPVGASIAAASAQGLSRLGTDWKTCTTRNARAFLGLDERPNPPSGQDEDHPEEHR